MSGDARVLEGAPRRLEAAHVRAPDELVQLAIVDHRPRLEVGDHRGNPAGVDGGTLESFALWVNERSAIAIQTASLSREGAASAWH